MKLLQNHLIDYQVLAKACKYYEEKGFKQVEVPWIVNRLYMELTCPLPGVGYAMGLDNGHDYLVCSAEQGFIRNAILGEDKYKPRQFYYAVSPCFRDEERDATHSTWFMKLELFAMGTKVDADYAAATFASLAHDCHTKLGVKDLTYVETKIGWDINQGDLELGSYGVRNLMGDEWIAYGTGVALPRISLAREKSKRRKATVVNGKGRTRGDGWEQG